MSKRVIHLHGHLGKVFGKRFELQVETAAEAIRALNANFPGRFMKALSEGSYRVVRGNLKKGIDLAEEHIAEFRLGVADLHIIPIVQGSRNKGGGALKAILGVALVGIAIFASGGTLAAPLSGMSTAIPGMMGLTYGNLAFIGAGLALAGVSAMMSSAEKAKKRDESSMIGPINVSEQGGAVPLAYGRVMTGSIVGSSGTDIEQIGTWKQPGTVAGNPGTVTIDGVVHDVQGGVIG